MTDLSHRLPLKSLLPAAERTAWSEPTLVDLPTLTDLTLQSAGAPGGDAITGSGGSSGLTF